MSIVLYNPTNERMKVTFGGRNFFLDPDSKTKVEDACGKHVLNEYSQRGLCSLDYGDESNVEAIAKVGRETNKAFKIKQIEDYNEQNHARKAIGLPYNHPTKLIVKYAEELSLKLEESYRVDDSVAKRSKELEAENVELKERIDYMQTQQNKMAEKMNKFFDAQGAKQDMPKEKTEAENLQGPVPVAKKRGPKPKVK